MKIALCCIAKCENLYLSEWVNHHLNLGFDHIYIYDNNDTDGERCEDIIGKENPNVNVLKYFIGKKQRGCETQIAAYNDFYQRFGGTYDWVLYLDVDEFLVINGYENVCGYIKDITKPSTKSVRLNWKCYDDNDDLHYECLPVRERFTRVCEDETLSYYKKHFYRTKLIGFKAINVHYSNIRGDVVDCDGKYATYSTFVTSDTYNHNKAYIAHYATKSADEYYMVKKKRRGNGIGNDRLSIEHYFKYNKRTEEKERYLTDLFAGKVEQVNFEESKVGVVDRKPSDSISVCIDEYNNSPYYRITEYEDCYPFIPRIVNTKLGCSEKIHVIVVNINQLSYTKNCINDLIAQTSKFDLTLFDQNSNEPDTIEYLDFVKSLDGKAGRVNVVKNDCNAPLNMIWNWFYKKTTNQYLCFLNNDVRIPDNFIKDTVETLETDKTCGIAIHVTNNEFIQRKNNLEYVTDNTSMQGWDFTIRRNVYTLIPTDLILYCGDNYLFEQMYLNGGKCATILSSPIIHYKAKSQVSNAEFFKNLKTKESKIYKAKYRKHKMMLGELSNFDLLKFENIQKYIFKNIYRNVCYTVISGDYDDIIEPSVITFGWHYLCYSDKKIKSNIYELIPIPFELNKLSQVKRQRMLKILPHKFIPNYEVCVYVDSNITIKCDLNWLFNNYCNGSEFSVTTHPLRTCIYEEARECIKRKKDTKESIEKHIAMIHETGFPENYGLNETGLLVRKNTQNVNLVMEEWAKMIIDWSHRDQLSLSYVLWKLNYKPNNLPKETVRESDLFSIKPHKIKKIY